MWGPEVSKTFAARKCGCVARGSSSDRHFAHKIGATNAPFKMFGKAISTAKNEGTKVTFAEMIEGSLDMKYHLKS